MPEIDDQRFHSRGAQFLLNLPQFVNSAAPDFGDLHVSDRQR